jgi:hypothetical protein
MVYFDHRRNLDALTFFSLRSFLTHISSSPADSDSASIGESIRYGQDIDAMLQLPGRPARVRIHAVPVLDDRGRLVLYAGTASTLLDTYDGNSRPAGGCAGGEAAAAIADRLAGHVERAMGWGRAGLSPAERRRLEKAATGPAAPAGLTISDPQRPGEPLVRGSESL